MKMTVIEKEVNGIARNKLHNFDDLSCPETKNEKRTKSRSQDQLGRTETIR
jgi:hypothetical protein